MNVTPRVDDGILIRSKRLNLPQQNVLNQQNKKDYLKDLLTYIGQEGIISSETLKSTGESEESLLFITRPFINCVIIVSIINL